MARKGFDLAALAKESMGEKMSNLDIETVEMIPAARIRANEANFYEMSDLEELAASIELVGLMTPLTVKVDPTGGAGYVIIDGERRFRALTEILGRAEIPCIRKTPVNAVIEELMLIEANRQQRKMTAGELSRQAERYTELLAKLRDSGVPVPGRLRKAVAEAMQLSESKLARLSAIRKNLNSDLLELFDKGELNESQAYEYSKLPAARQVTVAGEHPTISADLIAAKAEYAEKCYDFRACPYGGACSHGNGMFHRSATEPQWAWCLSNESYSCCKTCPRRFTCTSVCSCAKDDIMRERAERQAADEERTEKTAEARKQAAQERKARMSANLQRAEKAWAAFKRHREASGIELDDERFKTLFGYGYAESLKAYEDRSCDDFDMEDSPVDMLSSEELVELAEILGCSIDELAGVDAPMSNLDTNAAGGLVWHDTVIEGPPPEGTRNVICWTAFGHELYRPLPSMLKTEFEINKHTNCRWWAAVEGPDLSGYIEDDLTEEDDDET